MAPRAYWKGYLKLFLVSCPVRMFSATTQTSRITFHMLHKDTHNRIQMKPHDPEIGEVDRADLVKGYEFEKDRYVVIDSEDLEKIQVNTSKTINISAFVDAEEIDPLYLDSPYYLAPDGAVADEAFRVIADAMRRKRKAALARVVLANRDRQVALSVHGKGLVMTTLRTADEVRAAAPYFEEIGEGPLDPEMVALAEQIIDQKTTRFDPAVVEDEYQKALVELVQAKLRGQKPVVARAPERGNVVNLMEALKRSLSDEQIAKPPAKSRSAAPRAKSKGAAAGGTKSSGSSRKPRKAG